MNGCSIEESTELLQQKVSVLVASWEAIELKSTSSVRFDWFVFLTEHHSIWIVSTAFFAIIGWATLAYEVRRMKNLTSSREPLWDVAKFCLMWFVWIFHCEVPVAWHSYYSGWFMAAFFFLSGLVQNRDRSECMLSWKTFVRVMRDNVLNYILLVVLTCRLSLGVYKWSIPWFFIALATCRIVVEPLYHMLTNLGEIVSSLVVVACAFSIPWLLRIHAINIPLPDCIGSSPCTDALYCLYISWWIMQSWLFYAIGFLIDANILAHALKTRTAHFICIAIVVVVWSLMRAGLVEGPDVFVRHGKLYENGLLREYANDIVAKLFCTLLLLGCLAPMSSMGGILTDLLAQLGQRTLYGYWLNLFLVMMLGEDHAKV